MAMFPILQSFGNCIDCYRCLRHCELKAISFRTGQANIKVDQCVLCGKCVKECPQFSKSITDQIPQLQKMLESEKVVLLLPPTYSGFFSRWSREELYARLKRIGFFAVEEEATFGEAYYNAYADLVIHANDYVISSQCPIVVSLIEKHYPKLIPNLAPIANHTVICAERVRKMYGEEVKVVAVTSCLELMQNSSLDAVLTFDQALDFIFTYKYTPEELAETAVEPMKYAPVGMDMALSGGLGRYMSRHRGIPQEERVHISGLGNCVEALEELQKDSALRPAMFIELCGCEKGCIGGFGMEQKGMLEKKLEVNSYKARYRDLPKRNTDREVSTTCTFTDRHVDSKPVDNARIREILTTLKQYNRKVINCGACGYDTCYEKAKAVALGEASETMCIPYMRAKSQSAANTVFQSNPNGIIIFDKDYIIQDYNPVAREMFSGWGLKTGNAMFEYFPYDQFEQVVETGRGLKEYIAHYDDLGLITRQTVVRMQDTRDLYMVTMEDITAEEKRKAELQKVKNETLEKANEVINKQMFVAQEIAGLLGETTADTKIILLDLIRQFREESK